jgi:hypothetical protein
MSKKGEVVPFPLGSSTDVDDATMNTLEETVRQGMTDVIVVGLDAEGDLTIVQDPRMSPERVHFLLSKALARAAQEGLDPDLEDDDGEEEQEDDEAFEDD